MHHLPNYVKMDTQTLLILAILIPTLAFLYKALFPKPSLPLPPGPRGLPVLGSLLQVGPRPHTSLLALAHAYGPIMHLRMASIPTIVVSDSAYAELFLKMHDAPFANRPPSETFRILSYNFRSFAFTEQGPYWRHVRKLCVGQLLCGPKIASFRSSRQEEVELLVRRMEAKAAAREEVDVSEVLAAVVADIVCRMILGKKYMTEGKEGVRFREKTRELMELMSEFNVNDFIPALGFLDLQGVKKRMKVVHEEFDAFMEKIVDEHLEEGRGRRKEGGERDFVDVMLGFVEAGEEVEGIKFDRTSVKAIVLDMLEAGLDTMRTPIEWALSELIINPKIMKKVQDEIASVVGPDRLVEESDLASLPYLSMVVKETLRLHPLSAFLFHYGKEEHEVGGFRIPRNANIMISLWALGRDPNVFPRPEEFVPERFVENSVEFRGNDYRLLSFGSGRRMCAGMQLAMLVVPLVLAQLVHCFDWELPKGMSALELDMTEAYGFTMPRAKHLWAVPTKRLEI